MNNSMHMKSQMWMKQTNSLKTTSYQNSPMLKEVAEQSLIHTLKNLQIEISRSIWFYWLALPNT
jgi:hypothetical protein